MPVRVAVRVRPPLTREIEDGAFHSCLAVSHGSAAGGPPEGDADESVTSGASDVFLTTVDEAVVADDRSASASASAAPGLRQFRFDHVSDENESTSALFDAVCADSCEDVIRGKNATVLAYGQTGSGKTHTIFGERGDGVAYLAARALFAQKAARKVDIAVSFLQMYQSSVMDLLSPGRKLPIRSSPGGATTVVGLSEHPVQSEADVRALIEAGLKGRQVASTALNATSSRSHAILTLLVRQQGSRDPAKLHVVDLAGSERVRDSRVEGTNLREATQINLSLYHLVRVVQALAKPKSERGRVPYADDKLSLLLKDSLGGPHKTTVIATVSPAQRHARESLSTLNFANACTSIVNRSAVKEMESRRRDQNRVNLGQTDDSTQQKRTREARETQRRKAAEVFPWTDVEPGSQQCPGGFTTIKTSMGAARILAYGDPDSPLVVCLHGHPSSAAGTYGDYDTFPLLKALACTGHYAVAFDMPGCNSKSSTSDYVNGGAAFRTRSDVCLAPDGPADAVAALIRSLSKAKNPRATIIGYDWGGGIALSMAHSSKHRRFLEKIVLFHPAYNEPTGNPISQVQSPTLVLWCKEDQFHSWPHFRGTAAKLKKALTGGGSSKNGGNSYDEWVFSERRYATVSWWPHGTDIVRRIVKFLTGKDPCLFDGQLGRVSDRAEVDAKTTTGEGVVRRNNIVLASDAQTLVKLAESANGKDGPVASFVKAFDSGTLNDLYRSASDALDPLKARKLFAGLPKLTPDLLRLEPHALVTSGLWEELPRGCAAIRSASRFQPGRRVLVRCQGIDCVPGSPTFMQCVPGGCTEERSTFRAKVVSADERRVTVAIETDSVGGEVSLEFDHSTLMGLNGHDEYPLVRDVVQLEDGIRCDYSSPLCRAKMCEIALALRPCVSELDFDTISPEELEQHQLEAVRRIRSCLDLTTFQRSDEGQLNAGGGRTRDRARYCKDDAARFAIHGQGHCHTVSSVMAAFFSPFAPVLGIDLRYRGGYAWNTLDDEVRDLPERHQWLEYTTVPSLKSFVCDLYHEDGSDVPDPTFLTLPAEFVYQAQNYPHGRCPVKRR